MTLVAGEHLVAFQVITLSPLVISRYHLHLTMEINFKEIIFNHLMGEVTKLNFVTERNFRNQL